MSSAHDREHMARALRLAASGTGSTYPNPSVGAVIAKGKTVLASGRSQMAGGSHAEVVALRRAGARAKGATMYVTLEPCAHHGRTPPCTNAILEAGIKRVHVAISDPAAHVRGRGIRKLRRAGVEVVVGLARDAAVDVHAHYLHHEHTGLPWVTLKAAVSLDGRLATRLGDSKWLTGERARKDVHRRRARHHAIAVGVRTVLADDPALSVRHVRGVDPLPVVFDSRLRSVRKAPKVLREGAIFVHDRRASAAAIQRARAAGATTLRVRRKATGGLDVNAALRALGKAGIRSLMVEGGGELLASFVSARAWQRLALYRAPRLLGNGVPLLGKLGWDLIGATPELHVLERRRFGEDDLLIVAPAAAGSRKSLPA